MERGEEHFMLRAIAQAERSLGHTRPNPPVGAVIVKNGRIIGEGRHVRCGEDHAEVAALKSCVTSPAGATVYVTLEPCSKPGRVGACTDALVKAKVKRVVWACPDPNPKNRGKAARILRRAGIATGSGLCRKEAGELIRAFAKHVTEHLPYVTVKLGMSLDGRICDIHGESRWISSREARKATGLLRERVDVIMVGAETVRKDDPSLLSHGLPNDDLVRVVVTKSGRLPKNARIFTDGAKNVTIVYRRPKNMREVMEDLARRGYMHVLCEGGLTLARSLADEGLVDEWILDSSPIVLGSRRITQVGRGSLVSVSVAGGDVISVWRKGKE